MGRVLLPAKIVRRSFQDVPQHAARGRNPETYHLCQYSVDLPKLADGAGWPGLLILLTLLRCGCPVLRALCEGRVSGCRQSRLPCVCSPLDPGTAPGFSPLSRSVPLLCGKLLRTKPCNSMWVIACSPNCGKRNSTLALLLSTINATCFSLVVPLPILRGTG